MKKYEKPSIEIETFELAEHIASCAFDKKGDVFVGDDPSWIVYSSGSCSMTTQEAGGIFESYCDTNGGSDGVKLLYNS